MPDRLLYIIHAADDRALAKFLRSECVSGVVGLHVFLSSQTGDIPTGSDWLPEIQKNLKAATVFLLLLTPRSIKKFWVWYEAGAAWKSGHRCFPVAAAGLNRSDILLPLGAWQTLNLDDPDDAALLFKDLGGHLDDPQAFCRAARAAALSPPGTLSESEVQQIREAFGRLGDPPKLLLRRMLIGSLTLEEMAAALSAVSFVHDPVSVEKMRDVLKNHNLVEGDEQGRWRVRSEVKEALQACFSPPLSKVDQVDRRSGPM